MAITITSEPKAYSPSGNPLSYTFRSDQTGQANFSYIVNTYVNGALAREERVYPESAAFAHIDISETVDSLLSAPTIISGLNNDSGTTASIHIEVIESYGTPAIEQASATSTTTKAFKASIDNLTFETIDFDATYKNTKWLTNNPTNDLSILREQTILYSMITGGGSELIEFKFYASNGLLLHTFSESQTYNIWQVNINNDNLISTTGISLFQLESTAYFTMQIGISDILTFNYLDEFCYNPKALLWSNQYGSFDSFIFSHSDNRKVDTTKKSFKRQFGGWSGSSFVYDSTLSGDIDYVKTKTVKGELVSTYMTESVHNWMVELYDSTFYLLYDSLGNPGEAVNITGNSYNYKQDRFEELIMEVITYKLSNSSKSIRR